MIRSLPAIFFFSVSFAAAAAGTPGGSAIFPQLDAAMPQRERDFLSIIGTARDQLNQARTHDAIANARMTLQVNIMNFVDTSYDAQSWAGIIKEHGRTREGDAWVAIEIGPDVSVTTIRDLADDPEHITLIRAHTPVSEQLKHISIGDRVAFSGTMVRYLITTDETMIQRPLTFWHLTEIKPLSE